VLAVGDDELAVRDSDNTSLEVAKGGHMWEGLGNSREQTSGNLAGQFWASRKAGVPGALRVPIYFIIMLFNGYIHILLIITNPIIYICYIIC
jgi:hypothetical protein